MSTPLERISFGGSGSCENVLSKRRVEQARERFSVNLILKYTNTESSVLIQSCLNHARCIHLLQSSIIKPIGFSGHVLTESMSICYPVRLLSYLSIHHLLCLLIRS